MTEGFPTPQNVSVLDYMEGLPPPENWYTVIELAKKWGISPTKVARLAEEYRSEHEEYFRKFTPRDGKKSEYVSPELAEVLHDRFKGEIEKKEKIKEIEEKWHTKNQIANRLGISDNWINKIIEPYRKSNPDWILTRKDIKGKTTHEYIHPDLEEIIKEKVREFQKWKTAVEIKEELASEGITISDNSIRSFARTYKHSHPDWFLERTSQDIGQGDELYSNQLVEKILENFRQYPPPPEGWRTVPDLAEELAVSYSTITKAAKKYTEKDESLEKKHRDLNGVHTYFSPELIDKIKIDIKEMQAPPEGSISIDNLADELSIKKKVIKRIAAEADANFPGQAKLYYNKEKNNTVTLFIHKPLADFIREQVSLRKDELNKEDKNKKLETDLEDLLKDVEKGDSLTAQQFRSLIGLFGPSKVLDILYKFRPEFRGLPVKEEYVKSLMADYIGDFLVVRHGFRVDDLPIAVEFVKDPKLREGLLEIMKEACLEYYHLEKRKNKDRQDKEIIEEYIGGVRQKSANLGSTDIDFVITELEKYYSGLLSIEKPEKIVLGLKEGRDFPDLNQRINIRELSDKKKILIADEMGLGKSASAILTKESLGIKQALVVVPSNVVSTWVDNKKKKGYLHTYFKPGENPSVLVVESIEDLQRDTSTYDYIVISHERMTEEYTTELMKLDPGMLIVDEVHKFKNVNEGVRSQLLLSLAKKIEGDDKYLAILSGTPVPNKIEDVALILRLLYPEKFNEMKNSEMVRSIINGDLIDLRSLLVPRMQMKSLRESVEMPQHIEHEPIYVDLTELERDVYGAILEEEDELTATQKIQKLRQFLMNPEIVDPTPGVICSKAKRVEKELQDDFQKVDKIVMFVNDYVENIIRGPGSIIEKINLPPNVNVEIIEGEKNTSKKTRQEIQDRLNSSDEKMLVVVSGQTASEGVDFSGGEMVYFYNEPWTEYIKAQQLARVYRPGLKHELESKTFIGKGTIEEGIHQFIAMKKRAVEKLLRGVPLTELEREIIEKTEDQDENKEINPELARYYFNKWEKLMQIFGEVWEIGEKEFMRYLDIQGKEMTRGEEYADAYQELGRRNYQSNANRIATTVLKKFIEDNGEPVDSLSILDLASGPEMLKRHSGDELAGRITATDINPAHFKKEEGMKRVIGQLTRLPFENNSFDYLNLTFALHYFDFKPTKGRIDRVEVLKEMSRVLKVGGRAIIDLVHTDDFSDWEGFKQNIRVLGFKVVEDYTGKIVVGKSYQSKFITLEKVENIDDNFSVEDFVGHMSKGEPNSFKLIEVNEKGEKIKRRAKKSKKGAGLKDSRRLITDFSLGGKQFHIDFNEEDQKTYVEEQEIIAKGEGMKKEHGSIEAIPDDEVIDNLFVRYRPKKSYKLFRRMKRNQGGVIIK